MKKLFATMLAGALLLSAGVFCGKQSGLKTQEMITQAEETYVRGFWSSEAGVKERKVSSTSNETYAEESRRWQGLPTIAVTEGGRMWCAWQTGDSIEGPDGVDNYNVTFPIIHIPSRFVNRISQFFVKFFYFTSATVSRQIASSSFVGITATFTLESAAEITQLSPLFAFASASRVMPR